MAFTDLKVPELREVVEQFVGEEDAKSCKNKRELLALLAEEGVLYEDYLRLKDAEPVDPAELLDDDHKVVVAPVALVADVVESAPVDNVVVKMTRQNFTYEIKGHRFTKDHPFVVMTADEAQDVFDTEGEGFRLATPREVSEYYS